jgi:hypothetical protein
MGYSASKNASLYEYCGGDSVSWIDPMGLRPIALDFKAFISTAHTGPSGWFDQPNDFSWGTADRWELQGDGRGVRRKRNFSNEKLGKDRKSTIGPSPSR